MTNHLNKTYTYLDIINKEMKTIGICFAFFVICYGYEITNFNLSIDEEFFAFDGVNWLGIGRWALQLITIALWPQPTTPFGPFILFGLFGSISYAVLLHVFEIENPRLVHFIIFPIFIAFPVWLNQVEFSSNIIGCGIALLLNGLAILFSKELFLKLLARRGWQEIQKILMTIALIAIAVGIYQSFIFLYIVLGIAVSLHLYANDGCNLKLYFQRILVVFSIAAAAFILSIVIGKLFMWVYHIEQSKYANQFLKINELLNRPFEILTITLLQIKKIYFSYWKQFGLARYVFVSILLSGATILLLGKISNKDIIRKLVVICSLIFILIVPFFLNPFMGGELTIRTFVSIPTVVWLFMFLPLIFSHSKKVEVFILVMGVIAFVQILYIQSVVQARSWTVQKHDELLANSIYDRIVKVSGSDSDNAPIKIEIAGMKKPKPPYPIVYSATSGASFFEWDDGNKYRMIAFMKLIGFDNLIPATKDECNKLLPALTLMPSWPASGSVKLVRDVVIIKLSNDQPIICK